MEQHPVPQNIIDVEFKLFGSFTLKQFSKIIIACLIAVVIYFLPIIPFIIKVPIILMVVGAGILSALIQNFGVWLNGFAKSLFISPRYVWIKRESTPELLRMKQKEAVKKAQTVSTQTNRTKIDIADVSLDKLFGSKASEENALEIEKDFDPDPVRSSNLDRMYSQVFSGGTTPHLPQAVQQAQPVVQDITQTSLTPAQKIEKEIAQLKFELSRLNKEAQYQQKEQQIIARINQLYSQSQRMQTEQATNYPQNTPIQSSVSVGNTVTVTPVEKTTKIVFGIVVDSSDHPISQAGVVFENTQDQSTTRAVSTTDGKFSSAEMPQGVYLIKIEHPGYQFHNYQIDLSQQKLPAFKFRAK